MIKTVKKIKNQEDKVTCYKLIKQDDTIHFVPLNEKNTDYQNIQEWVAEGNTIEEAD